MDKKNITLGSLFDGSGGFPLAGKMAGITPVWASEIEPFPVRVTTKNFPDMKHYGDVNKINGGEIEPADIITFGSPCFPKGTLIFTEDGYVPIEDIQPGMRVLTHKGKWRKVIDFGVKESNTIILSDGCNTLECTPDHKIFTGNDKWTPAKDMLKRSWAIPIQFNHSELLPPPQGFSEKFFYLLGKWLGNGWYSGNFLYIKCPKDIKLEEALLMESDEWQVCGDGLTMLYKIKSKGLIPWLGENFGSRKSDKRIHLGVYSLEDDYKKALLDGIKKSRLNKKMAYEVKLLAQILGLKATLVKKYIFPPSDGVDYAVKIKGRLTKKDQLHAWAEVKKIKSTGKIKKVYNITVEKDHSYIADGIVVKNCQNMSLAGRREGLNGKESVLFYQAIRIIREMRKETNGEYPRYALWENVPGAFSSNKGEDFRCVLEALSGIAGQTNIHIPMPEKGKWANSGEIVADTWSIAWRVLDAQYWGVPQRRKRIFLIADFRGCSAPKILFESEGLSGYSAQGFKSWQETACNIARSSCGTIYAIGDRSQVSVSEDISPTLMSEQHGHAPCVYENHIKDARIKGPLTVSPTVVANYGTGGNNTPLVKEAYGICAKQSNSPGSGFYRADTPGTLDTSGSNPSCNQGVVAFAQNQRNEIRNLGEKSGALCANGGMKQQTYICDFYGKQTHSSYEEGKAPTLKARTNEDLVVSLQGNMIGRQDKNGPLGSGINENVSFTLNTTDKHAVVYNASKASYMTRINKDISDPLVATDWKDPQIIGLTASGKDVSGTLNASMGDKRCLGNQEAFSGDFYTYDKKYVVRRLTPLECCRLQGFPDWWTSDLETDNPTDEEIAFWEDVFENYRLATNPDKKPKTGNQIAKWLKSPYSDTAAYKMWGNGVALPCVYFIMEGIAWAIKEGL